MNRNNTETTWRNNNTIPDGTFVLTDNKPPLVYNSAAFLWSPFGYTEEILIPGNEALTIVTPVSIINTFLVGYMPETNASVRQGGTI